MPQSVFSAYSETYAKETKKKIDHTKHINQVNISLCLHASELKNIFQNDAHLDRNVISTSLFIVLKEKML
jgi:hypothetical protein